MEDANNDKDKQSRGKNQVHPVSEVNVTHPFYHTGQPPFSLNILGIITLTISIAVPLISNDLKHSHTLFYSSEEHFLSDNLNKVSSCFKI